MNTEQNKRPSSEQHPFRFAFAATFTAEPLRRTVAFWGQQLHGDFEIRFAPYNQIAQTLLDPASEFSANAHGVNVVLLRLDDMGQFESGDVGQLETNVRHLVEELRASPARLNVPLIVALCPSSPDFLAVPERSALKARLSSLLAAGLEETPGIQYIHYNEIDRMYPVEERDNPEGERLGRIPYTEEFYCALATTVVRRTHALIRAPFKLIALDCDGTLWQGICGEDGPEGVSLDPPRRTLHECMLDQREAGMVLTLASKNNEEDVLETFRVHPEFPLGLRHFVTWRLNWETKAENLSSISEQLGLGVDSFIFIDDNPKECAELEQAIPEVLTLALPGDIGQTPHFLEHVWAFDHPVVTEEDRNRNAYYAQAAEFGNEVRRSGSLEDFMASLKLRVSVYPVSPERLPRASQLTQRTNQFNTTTIRRSEQDIQTLIAEGHECLAADVSDRFGDYGLVGLMIVRREGSAAVVDSMMLSCRALGRGVEHRMLADVVRRGFDSVVIPYVRSAKNLPARQFLESIEAGVREETAQGFVLRIPASDLAKLRWSPGATSHQAAPKPRSTSSSGHRTLDYARIATQLSTVGDILQAVRSAATTQTVDATMTETEQVLARIWSELLERPRVARTDNFFDLGGHSLVAVLLLLRIREVFGVELSVDDVYAANLTLADLAARIETAQLGDIDPQEYAAMLAEIENLSDEEARELLARENSRQA